MNEKIQKHIHLLSIVVLPLLLAACTVVVAQPPVADSLDEFTAQVEKAVIERNFEAMPALMSDSFTLAYWRSESVGVTPAEAVEQLRKDLSAPAPVQFVSGVDLAALLDGADPLAMAGPDVDLVSALYSTGWGSDGTGEAMLLVARNANGGFYWYGTLYAFDGFDDRPASRPPTATATPLPTGFDVRSTSVRYVMAQTNVNMRGGPGTTYAIIGGVAEGQVALVTGVTADGGWWRVICPNDTVGNCFVSADPALTQPTRAPGGPGTPPTDVPPVDSGEAIVESITVNVLESFPVQAQAVVRGQLPDACAFVENVRVLRESRTFRIQLRIARQPNQRCAQVLTPFEEVVSLDVNGLPAGEYDVRVNNLRTTFSLAVDNEPITPTPQGNSEALPTDVHDLLALENVNIRSGPRFDAPVIGRILAGEYAGVNGISADGGWWRIDCAIDQNGNCWVTADPALTLGWSGPGVPEAVLSTAVQYVMAQNDVNIYAGQSTDFPVVGNVAGGQTALVTGVNRNGTWWRVICPDDSVGSCWVSADPSQTQPTTAPGS